ncbi:Uncharacterised protein [Vibrio cholerae]|nr:Uncharacterised protein [Vibrio cholerae]
MARSHSMRRSTSCKICFNRNAKASVMLAFSCLLFQVMA